MGDCFIILNGKPQGELGLFAIPISSSEALITACLYSAVALLSSVARNLVPICTPSAPIFRNFTISLWVKIPPATITGKLPCFIAASLTGGKRFSSLLDSSPMSSILNPRCPPANGPSSTTASGLQPNLSHFLHISSSALADDTIGISAVSLGGWMAGRLSGNPAPEIIKSARASMAAVTDSL